MTHMFIDRTCLVCIGVCRAAQCDRWTHYDAERTCRADTVLTAAPDTTPTVLFCHVCRTV